MVAVALVLLVEEHSNLWLTLPAAIIIGREIVVSALREWMAELGARAQVAVSNLGKWKTAAQMVALVILLANPPQPTIWVGMGYALLIVAAGLTLWSMINYLMAAWPHLSTTERNKNFLIKGLTAAFDRIEWRPSPRQRGNSSVGRARPCQGRGREFESRFPLQFKDRAAEIMRRLRFEAGWQSGYAADCKSVYAGSIPTSASILEEPQAIRCLGLFFASQNARPPVLPVSGGKRFRRCYLYSMGLSLRRIAMRRLSAFAFAILFSSPLLAMHCPMDMAKIDELLKTNPPKDAATLQQVRELRAEGEQLHQAGKHADSVRVLGRALYLLGQKP